MSELLKPEEIDALAPTKEELDAYLCEPDDEVAASLDPQTKRMAARIILYTDKVAKAQYAKCNKGLDRPKIICLCGSSRFCAEMAVIAWTFEKEGYITLGLHLLPADYTRVESHLAEAEGVAEKMDELHLRKIDLADEVFVVNKNGYIGESTRREIDYATKLNKPIKYLEDKDG